MLCENSHSAALIHSITPSQSKFLAIFRQQARNSFIISEGTVLGGQSGKTRTQPAYCDSPELDADSSSLPHPSARFFRRLVFVRFAGREPPRLYESATMSELTYCTTDRGRAEFEPRVQGCPKQEYRCCAPTSFRARKEDECSAVEEQMRHW